jgi:hypothetical protein
MVADRLSAPALQMGHDIRKEAAGAARGIVHPLSGLRIDQLDQQSTHGRRRAEVDPRGIGQ